MISGYSKTTVFGVVLTVIGVACFIVASQFMSAQDGGGMAGLPVAFLIIAAFVLMGLGVVISVTALVVSQFKSGQGGAVEDGVSTPKSSTDNKRRQ